MRPAALALALALALVPGTAAADRPHLRSAAADKHLQAGLDHFDAKDYARASKELQLARLIEPTPFLLYSEAQAERLAGHCDKAIDRYKEYLRIEGTPPQSSELARGFIKQCEQSMPTPPPELAEAQRAPAGARPWYTNRLGGALTVSGVIALSVGLGYLSSSANSEQRAGEAMFLDVHDAALVDASHERTIGAAAVTLGLGLVAGGVYVYLTRSKPDRPGAILTANGHAIVVAGRF